MNKKTRAGFVTIIGETNSGKSTLINSMLKKNKLLVNKKSSTTIKNKRIVFTKDNYQAIFLDTPGVLKTKSRVEDKINRNFSNALKGIDLVILLTEYWKNPIEKIINNLKRKDLKIILVLTKIDIQNKEKISLSKDLEKMIIDKVEISSVENLNIDKLFSKIVKNLPYGDFLYDVKNEIEVIETDKELVNESIRHTALNLLNDEVPYKLEIKTIKFEDKPNIIMIDSVILVKKNSLKGILIGKNGSMIKKIGQSTRIKLEKDFNKKIYLNLQVKYIGK